MVNVAPEKAREGKRKALYTAIEKSKGISTTPVELRVGTHRYRVPMNYLTPYGDWKGQKEFDYAGVSVFLPDFGGYDRKNFIDPFHPERIKARWSDKGVTDVEDGLRRLIRFGVLEAKPSLHRDQLEGYKHSDSEWGRVQWIGRGNHGFLVSINCSHDAPNPGCQVQYRHASNDYWLVYEFRAQHLSKWRDIDDGVNRLLMSWRVGQ